MGPYDMWVSERLTGSAYAGSRFKKERAAAKRDDTKDFWDVIRKEQRLLDLLSVIIARANADIIRNLPARGRYAPSSPSEPPSASSSPQYEVDDDDDDRKENYSPQWAGVVARL